MLLHVLTQSFQSKQRSRASFRFVICFHDIGSLRAFVCELHVFSITRINRKCWLSVCLYLFCSVASKFVQLCLVQIFSTFQYLWVSRFGKI